MTLDADDIYVDWDLWLIRLARFISTRSKDPSTKVGAVIVRPDKTIASTGYNGFPRGVVDDQARLDNREIKYKLVVHAEMNAILTAREPLHGYSLYLWPFAPCDRCAAAIIQSGIKRIYAPDSTRRDHSERWAEAHKWADLMYAEAGVDLKLIGWS